MERDGGCGAVCWGSSCRAWGDRVGSCATAHQGLSPQCATLVWEGLVCFIGVKCTFPSRPSE